MNFRQITFSETQGERGHKKPGLLVTPALSLSCCALLPDEPAGQEAAAYQHSARAQREQRRRAATARRRQCLLLPLLRSGGRGWGGSRGGLRGWGRSRSGRGRRSRSSLRRRGRRSLTRGLGHNTTGLRLYNLIRTIGLSLRSSGRSRLGLGVGHHSWLILGQGGRGGQQGHPHHRHQHHQLLQPNLSPLARKFVSLGGGPSVKKVRLQKSDSLYSTSATVLLAASGRRLVDLTRALGRVGGAHGNGGADLLELKVIRGGAVLENVGQVLGVAGVANTLDAHALGGVVTAAGDREVLVELSALAFLLFLLADLRYDRNGGQGEHRQKRRQQHQLPHIVSPSIWLTSLCTLDPASTLPGVGTCSRPKLAEHGRTAPDPD